MRRVPVQIELTETYIVWVDVEDDQLSPDAVNELESDGHGMWHLIQGQDLVEGDLTVSVPSVYLDTTKVHDRPLMECGCFSHWDWRGECPRVKSLW